MNLNLTNIRRKWKWCEKLASTFFKDFFAMLNKVDFDKMEFLHLNEISFPAAVARNLFENRLQNLLNKHLPNWIMKSIVWSFLKLHSVGRISFLRIKNIWDSIESLKFLSWGCCTNIIYIMLLCKDIRIMHKTSNDKQVEAMKSNWRE